MKHITLIALALFSLLLASATGVLAQDATPTAENSNITIINEGNVLSDSDLDSVRSLASDFPLPLVIYITNQYHGAKIDFSRKVAKLVTENNVVIGISTYKDSNENDHYRLIGAGPKAGISSDMLDGAQNAADQYLRVAEGPQYVSAIAAIIGYLEGGLGSGSTGSTSTDNSGQSSGAAPSASSGSSFWGNVGVFLLVLFGLWLAFIFLRWLWRQGHPKPVGQQSGGAASEGDDYGRGYVGGGPVFYPIWLGGGSYGGGGGSLSMGGGNSASSAPSVNAGGGSFASAFGGAGGGSSASSNAGGGKFESSLGSAGGSSASNPSSGGGGGFQSVANVAGATASTEAAGAVAGAALNILGGILGAVFSAGSGGSGPDF
jgi:hypothetical protein